jgi:TRAP-type C4-dicarboxylate transport system substrate-binding protein
MHFRDAPKFVTETNQPVIFLIVEVNRTWYDSLPTDLQQIVDPDAAKEFVAINPQAIEIINWACKAWTGAAAN